MEMTRLKRVHTAIIIGAIVVAIIIGMKLAVDYTIPDHKLNVIETKIKYIEYNPTLADLSADVTFILHNPEDVPIRLIDLRYEIIMKDTGMVIDTGLMDFEHVTSIFEPNQTKPITSRLIIDATPSGEQGEALRAFMVGQSAVYFKGDLYYVPLDTEGNPTHDLEKYWFRSKNFSYLRDGDD